MEMITLLLLAVFVLAGTEAQSCNNKITGYYAHPSNCSKYYYCNGRAITEFDCSTSAAGWAKDFFCSTDSEKVNIMSSVAVKSIKQPNGVFRNLCPGEGWLSDFSSCNRYFRCWSQGNAFRQTLFDITAMCETSVYKTNCTKTDAETSPTGAKINLCAKKLDGYYAYPNNCNMFYYCSKETIFKFDCRTSSPGSFAFDFFCSSDTIKQGIVNSTTIRSSKLPSGNFRNHCAVEGWLADSKSCHQYYRCWQGNTEISQTSFDVTDVCRTSVYASKCIRAAIANTSTSSNLCANKADGYYHNATDCSRVYRCLSNVKTDFSCTDTTTDGWKDVADFFCRTGVTLPTIQYATAEPDCRTDGYFSVTTNCTRFFKCTSNVKTLLDITESGTGNCGDDYTQACIDQQRCNMKADGFYPDPNDCTKAYRCRGNLLTEFSCLDVSPAGWADVASFFCDSVNTLRTTQFTTTNPDCSVDGYFSNTADCNKFFKCTTSRLTLIDVTDQGTGRCGANFISMCNAERSVGCTGKVDGYYSVPSDCTKAYRCATNVRTDFSCADVTTSGWSDISPFFCDTTTTVAALRFARTRDCATDGWLSVTTDCTKYYRCDAGIDTLVDISNAGPYNCGSAYVAACAASP